MAIFLSDTFTDTDGVLLQNHTPDTGDTWSALGFDVNGTSSTQDAETRNNRGQSTSISALSRIYRNDATPASAEYSIEADFVIPGTSDSQQYTLVARMSPSGTSSSNVDRYVMYYLDHAISANRSFTIDKWVGGVQTTLINQSYDLGIGTFTIRFVIKDSEKSIVVNDVTIVSVSDNTITQIGKVGIGFPKNIVDTIYADNLSAIDITATPINKNINLFINGPISINDNITLFINGDTSGTPLVGDDNFCLTIDQLFKTADYNPQIIGRFITSPSSVTIEVWNVIGGTNDVISLINNSCYQINDTGRWAWSTINLPPLQHSNSQFVYRMTGINMEIFDGQFILKTNQTGQEKISRDNSHIRKI